MKAAAIVSAFTFVQAAACAGPGAVTGGPLESKRPLVSPDQTEALARGDVRIRVDGAQLFANGSPIRLVGVNHSGTEFACVKGTGIVDGPSDETLIQGIASWGANAVRIPLNSHCWLGSPEIDPRYSGSNYRNEIERIVDRFHAAHIVTILDLHWTAPRGERAVGLLPMPDADHAITFWESLATRFGKRGDVVFDLFNEPHEVSWPCWRNGCAIPARAGRNERYDAAGMQTLVDTVRGAGATNVILAAGLNYANDVEGWLEHAPRDPLKQIGASFHLYNFNPCRSHDCWNAALASLAAHVPIVVSELGEDDCASTFVLDFLDWKGAEKLSFLAWTWNTWDCKKGPALIESYDGAPTPFGAGVRERMRREAREARRR